jgi:hypothetical protein
MAGLALVPWLVDRRTAGMMDGDGAVGRSPQWMLAGLLVGALFVVLLGPGFSF